jgi:phospholipid transport system transporter-binding protein
MTLAWCLMSEFELQDLGDGRFALKGEMSFATADQILKSSQQVFGQYESLEVDMSEVGKADSAGLALLLEWKAQAGQRTCELNYVGIPDSLIAIAKTSLVKHLIVIKLFVTRWLTVKYAEGPVLPECFTNGDVGVLGILKNRIDR